MTAALFSPITLGGLTFPNRIAVAPMCQHAAVDGCATDWHLHHWMNLAMSGAGMVTVEMTDVERRGRLSHGCLGLYSDANEIAARRALDAAKRVAPASTRFGVQLGHAGRRGSKQLPWEGNGPLPQDADPWPVVSASAVPYNLGWPMPRPLDEDDMDTMADLFASAAKRAAGAGFDFIELHSAHGYLLHQFLSPLSNRRDDRYGGALENRLRFPLEVARRIRTSAPSLMLGVRISVTDWTDGGITMEEGIEIARAYHQAGAAYICCSGGGTSPSQRMPAGPGYQVHLSQAVRQATGAPTRTVGLIDDPQQADAIVAEGKADMVGLARAILADPRWPWRAAASLGEPLWSVPQLSRSVPVMQRWMKAG